MNTSFRGAGLLIVTVGVGLAIIFAALGLTGVLPMQIGLGLGVVVLSAASLTYIFFSRANAVTRTGYGSLLMILAVALIIPILTVNQQQQQVSAADQLYLSNLQTSAALYAQYCSLCHGLLGQGLSGPQLNDNPDVNKLSDQDINRIISAGIPGDPTKPAQLAMPAWLDAYGGSLTEEDIAGLVAFIRSSDPAYRKANGLADINGFNLIPATLTNPTQIAEYQQEKKSGSRPPLSQFTDDTAKTQVTVPIVDSTEIPGTNWSFSPRYIIIKAGTTVTWNNVSNQFHTVVPTNKGAFPDSGVLPAGTGTYTVTFSKAGDYPYFCSIHPAMTAWIIVQ
jgi:plastocyanin/mono/diheme cytochrome c family protein